MFIFNYFFYLIQKKKNGSKIFYKESYTIKFFYNNYKVGDH